MKTLNDFPAYREAKAKATELRTQLNEAERRVNELQAGTGKRPVKQSDRDAMALLAGDELPSEYGDRSGEISEAWRRVHALRLAIEMQLKEVALARSAASDVIAKEAKPKYDEIIRRQINVLGALAEVHKAEREFREALEVNDVAFTHVIPPAGYRMDLDFNHHLDWWLGEVAKLGYKGAK